MKITKFVHACLLVETPDRVALFDPGVMSEAALDVGALTRLDDIFITHVHGDHCSSKLLKKLLAKFPTVHITSTQEVVDSLAKEGIKATTSLPATAVLFDSPHEAVEPMFPSPQQIGVHYLNQFSHPGDGHSFTETMSILALPVTGPWGSTVNAVKLGLKLKPQHIVPIHDWHYRDEARTGMYDNLERIFGEAGITFHKLETGKPVEVKVEGGLINPS